MEHLTQQNIMEIPESEWYKYTLECGHEVYTRARLRVPRSFNEHFIRCRKPHVNDKPPEWKAVTKMEAVSNDIVRNVSDGFAFVLPGRILRTDGTTRDGHTVHSGNPYPYSASRDRDY